MNEILQKKYRDWNGEKNVEKYNQLEKELYDWCIENFDSLLMPKKMMDVKDEKNKQQLISAVAGFDYISKKDQLLEKYKDIIDEEYTSKLGGISFYDLHPEWIPFVGSNYINNKVLLVGESHYVDSVFDLSKYDFKNRWYNKSYSDICKDVKNSDDLWVFLKTYFWTRAVLVTFADGEPGAGYGIFANPLRELGLLGDKKNIKEFAFMNYFQRPSNWGAQLYSNEDDNDIAYTVFKEVISDKYLAPEKIIFLSQNAYNCFAKKAINEKDLFKNISIYKVCHPTCAWWNIPEEYKTKKGKTRHNNYGKKHFVDSYYGLIEPDFN